MIVICLDYASQCNKSGKSSLLGLLIFILGITCFGPICFVIKWFRRDITNNNNDMLLEGRTHGLEMILGERTLHDPFVSDGLLQQVYETWSNDENQLSCLCPPARYTSCNIIPQGNGFPYPSSASSDNLPESQVLTSTIVHQNERTKHQTHISAPQHEVSVPSTPPHYSHSKRCHPYHSSFPHYRSSLIHHSNQST